MDASKIRYAIEHRTGVKPDELSSADLLAAGCWDHVYVLPDNYNDRVRNIGDVLVQMLTRKPADGRLRMVVGQLCQALSYMLNSTSWRDGELHDFDLDTLKQKLGRFGYEPAEEKSIEQTVERLDRTTDRLDSNVKSLCDALERASRAAREKPIVRT